MPFFSSTNVSRIHYHIQAWFFSKGTSKNSVDLSLPMGRQLSKQKNWGHIQDGSLPSVGASKSFEEATRSDVT